MNWHGWLGFGVVILVYGIGLAFDPGFRTYINSRGKSRLRK